MRHINNKRTDSWTRIRLQKCLYLHAYLDLVWAFVVGFFLYTKLFKLGETTKWLSVIQYFALIILELTRSYLGLYGNLLRRIPDLAGFLMITTLQFVLLGYFLFNPYLLNTQTEITLHAVLSLLSIYEMKIGTLAVRQASDLAKVIYLTCIRDRTTHST